MRRFRLLFGILIGFVVIEFVGLVLLGLLVYETVPAGVLAGQTFIGKIPGVLAMVRVVDRATNGLYRAASPRDPLPQYDLTVDPKDWAMLQEALPKEIHSPWYGNLFLEEESKTWVKGGLRVDGKTYDVRVRVRGDLFNHWAYRKKSLRIEFEKDNLFRGIKSISLIIPEDRAWFGELLNVHRAQKFGLFHPPTRFVTISLNGSGPMLYVEMEHWTKEMLEKQGISDANVYQTGGGSSYFQQWNPMFTDTGYWEKYVSAESTPLDSYEEVEILRDLAVSNAHTEDGYAEKVHRFFNEEELIRWYAHAHLAGNAHIVDHNLRLLFLQSKGRFSPIPWDVHLFGYRSLMYPPTNSLWNELFRIPDLRFKLHKFLWEYVTDDTEVTDDIETAVNLRSQMEEAAYRDPIKLPSNRTIKQDLDRRMDQVKANIEETKKELEQCEVIVHQRVPSAEERATGILLKIDIIARGIADARLHEIHLPDSLAVLFTIGNLSVFRDDQALLMTLRAEPDTDGQAVIMLEGKGTELAADFGEVNAHGVLEAPHVRHQFLLKTNDSRADIPDVDLPLKLDIRNAITGKKADIIGNVLIDERTFTKNIPSNREEFLKKYPTFKADQEGGVELTGVQKFWETVIIPSNVPLRVLAGAEIGLGRDISILSYAPVTLEGTARNPVKFLRATGHPWGVFAVLNAKEPSRIDWGEFDGGGEARINGAYFSGMVAFHSSDVSIRDTVFRNAHGDDALNIKNIPADLARLRFEDNAADGLDIDIAGEGVLEDSIFTVSDGGDNNGDGIDLSWSNITLRNIFVRGSADKCISIGEKSEPLIQNATLEGCGIGIAVKDGSKVRAEQVMIRDNDTGIAGYIKKSIFPVPSIDIVDGTFEENGQDFLSLSGAVIVVDGEPVLP
ncbi:CotH kinase family protein [Candidatus Peregrinibacteria bacterium]|nr:CotH kinase family protein [Candidatus Peregrinibacteria bacterium]